MSNVDINQVLSQMRAMSAEARSAPSSEGLPGAPKLDFGEVMKNTLDSVSETSKQAKAMATAFESGDTSVNLPEVMIELQKASVSFQAISQVRNKLLTAYQEVMRMQV